MDYERLGDEVVKSALSHFSDAESQIKDSVAGMDIAPQTQPDHMVTAGVGDMADIGNRQSSGGGNVADSFVGLPIESLICGPIIAAAKGQQELTAVYVDGLMKLAYADGKPGKETNTLKFTVDRPVQSNDGNIISKKFEINAPLLSLVPVPAFTMDELTVDFNMEVKNSDMRSSETKSDIGSTLNYKSWYGLSANITGTVSSDSSHKRQTDSSATYQIHARAVQQQPSEGMAKLTALFSQMMEPIPTK